ncbi:MAG: nitrous oxide reductase accessory protein NosL [Roseibium sp.]|uniref:nitrous oxide reductase accessory protein NosL n=1 Tax=Roseibium sp. TaxID=1936156 RepID=UPI00263046E2|nr:nitrous oxide reductase accessory protein NosL [Roseibium sp.]MCV0427947.1 nitrous oxide reductase accessory protein NosL [Roseibium sp.]
MKRHLVMLFALGLLTACQEETQIAKPDPMALTPEAAGFYCQMTVLEHTGPKAQIHLTGNPFPFWFTQVRDAVAFRHSPEEPKNIAAIYVNDMDKAVSWDEPGFENWIDAEAAWFVVGSTQVGGMGAPEAIPFGTEAGANAFAAENGGSVLRFADIPVDYVLAPVDLSSASHVKADEVYGAKQ